MPPDARITGFCGRVGVEAPDGGACGPAYGRTPMDESLLSPSRAWTLLQDGRVQVIDLRGRDEVDLPRIPGARAIPFDELPSELSTLDRERPVVLVSGTGRKAAAAMKGAALGWNHRERCRGRRQSVAAGRAPDRDRRCLSPAATGMIAFCTSR